MFVTNSGSIRECVNDIRSKDQNPEVIFFMASSIFDIEELQKALRDNFPTSILQGTPTTGEIAPTVI